VFITTSPRLGARVARAVESQLKSDPVYFPAAMALAARGGIIIARNRGEAIALVNRIAAEHVVCDDDETAAAISTAGTIFVGEWSAQAAGDYATGSNHVLPTGGAARFRGGLSAADFVKITSVQRMSRAGLTGIAPAVVALAEAEGLTAHAESIRIRLRAGKEQ
jgi:histidinol dehydrogenase